MINYMKEAVARPGNSGTNLMQMLECRLDNVVHRLGFSTTIWGARQFVNHGHMQVNGKKVDIPSYRVQPGETISLAPKMRENPNVLDALDQHANVPTYMTFDRNAHGRSPRRRSRSARDIPVHGGRAVDRRALLPPRLIPITWISATERHTASPFLFSFSCFRASLLQDAEGFGRPAPSLPHVVRLAKPCSGVHSER